MEKNTAILIAIIALSVGAALGYISAPRTAPVTMNSSANGRHQMLDGSMMGGNGSSRSMSDMMTSMNADLEGKKGDDFDKAFLAEMIVHHQGAVQMAEQALTNAKHEEIRNLAFGIISAQNKEIGEMQAWQKSWYGIEQ